MESSETSPLPALPVKRRWRFQFGLRTLCLAFIVISVGVAIFGTRYYRDYQRQAAIKRVKELAGVILADRKDGFSRVYVAGPKITDPVLTELSWRLQFLPELREFDLVNAPISDNGLQHVSHLGQLEVLVVHECTITDEGVQRLNQVFPALKIKRTAPDPVATRLAMRKIYRHAMVAIAVSPDGREIATGSGDGLLRKWRGTGTAAVQTRVHADWLFSVSYSPDGKTLATGGGDNQIRLWDARTTKPVGELIGHTNDVHAVAFGPGNTLVSAGDDRTVRVWDLASKRERLVLTGHEAAIPAVKVSNKLGVIASGSRDHTIRLWSVETGKLIRQLLGHTADINALALDKTETLLASASHDGTVKVWELNSGREMATLAGHAGRVYAVTFLNGPSQTQIATAGADSTIRIWDSKTAAMRQVIRSPRLVANVIPQPNSALILATTVDGTLDTWNPADGQLVSSRTTWGPEQGLAISGTDWRAGGR